MSKQTNIFNIILDIPKMPKIDEADLTYIIHSADPSKAKKASFYSPLNSKWLGAFKIHKWPGHVFCLGNDDFLKEVRKASIEYFKQEYVIEFNKLESEMLTLAG